MLHTTWFLFGNSSDLAFSCWKWNSKANLLTIGIMILLPAHTSWQYLFRYYIYSFWIALFWRILDLYFVFTIHSATDCQDIMAQKASTYHAFSHSQSLLPHIYIALSSIWLSRHYGPKSIHSWCLLTFSISSTTHICCTIFYLTVKALWPKKHPLMVPSHILNLFYLTYTSHYLLFFFSLLNIW
jgi:hypothetical protein